MLCYFFLVFKKVCCRCGEVYTVTSSGEHRRKEECNYHSGRVLEQKGRYPGHSFFVEAVKSYNISCQNSTRSEYETFFAQGSAEIRSAVLLGMWLVSKACFL